MSESPTTRPSYTPGLAGYLLAWLASVLVYALVLPLAFGLERIGEYFGLVLVVAYFGAAVSLLVAPPGLILVHLCCRRVRAQWVHVLVAGLVGMLVVLPFWAAEPDEETMRFLLALGVSTATARLLVIPLVRQPRKV